MNTKRIKDTLDFAFEQLDKGDIKVAIEALGVLDELTLDGDFHAQREMLRTNIRLEQMIQDLNPKTRPSLRTETNINGGHVNLVVGNNLGVIEEHNVPSYSNETLRIISQGEGSSYIENKTTYSLRNQSETPELKVIETLTAKLVSTSIVNGKMYIIVMEHGKDPRVITVNEGECVIINGTKYMPSISGNQTFNFSF